MRLTLVCLAALISAAAFGQDFGPISTRNHRAIDLPFLRFDPHHGLVPSGHDEWDLSITSANDSRRLPEEGAPLVIEDQETERFLATYRKGLKNGNELSIELPILSRGGGFMDAIIEQWHEHVLHWVNPFRASQPYGQSIVQVPGSSFGSASGIGDVSLGIAHTINRRLDSEVAVKLPTGDGHRLLGSGGADAGFAFKYRQAIKGRWSLYGMLGLVAQSQGNALDSVRGLVPQEALTITYQPKSRDNYVLQWQGEASAVVTGNPGSDSAQRIVTFGYQRKISAGHMLELSFSEDRDLFSGHWEEGANIGPDFTIQIGYKIRK